jgi:hypothetical protein
LGISWHVEVAKLEVLEDFSPFSSSNGFKN